MTKSSARSYSAFAIEINFPLAVYAPGHTVELDLPCNVAIWKNCEVGGLINTFWNTRIIDYLFE